MKLGKKVPSIIGIVIFAVVIGVIVLDVFFLRGKVIFSKDARLGDTVTFTVKQLNVGHLIEIKDTTYRKRRGRYFLEFILKGPDGKEIINDKESIPREKIRYFEFTPTVLGDYTMKFGGRGLTRNPDLRVDILVNDKRFIRYFSF